MDIEPYVVAVGGSWDASVIQMSAGHLDAGIDYLTGDQNFSQLRILNARFLSDFPAEIIRLTDPGWPMDTRDAVQ